MKIWIIALFLPLLVDAKIEIHTELLDQEIDTYFNDPESYYNLEIRKLGDEEAPKNISAKKKIQWRKQFISSHRTSKSAPRVNDQVESLLKGFPIEKNIKVLQQRGLDKGKVHTQPWSDDYWPIYKGILGARYAEEEYDYLGMWDEANNYVMESPAQNVYRTMDEAKIDRLSPSEKFDLLLSGKKHRLTQNMWDQGRRYFESSEDGHIETWMGICHGWAPASYMLDRPRRSVEVTSFDGETKIKFYPADIKALASLLWASTNFPTHFIGGRCSLRDPDSDENGRPYSEDCQDNNPASFHLALTNGVGAQGKSFVMDVTYDYEVWNQPVTRYGYKFFHPNDRRQRGPLEESIIDIKDFKDDPYKKYRSPKTKYIVGVALEVFYSVETRPTQRDDESEEYDQSNSAFYVYDLELDKDYNIVGGEWYNRQYPDFLWTPDYQAQALTSADYYLLSYPLWNGEQALDQDIKSLAMRAAAGGTPLAYLVKSLIQLAQ